MQHSDDFLFGCIHCKCLAISPSHGECEPCLSCDEAIAIRDSFCVLCNMNDVSVHLVQFRDFFESKMSGAFLIGGTRGVFSEEANPKLWELLEEDEGYGRV